MSRRVAATTAAILLLPVAACSGDSTSDAIAYRIDESVTALVIGARAANVDIVTGDGPVTVTEDHHYSRGRPTTAHRVDGTTLRLTESGCGDDDARCDVRYRIRMPAAVSVDITAQAGAVTMDGVGGKISVTTEAGAVEGRALTSDAVTVRTELGATSLEFAEAPSAVDTTTSMGAVDLRVPGTTAYAVDVRTPAGAERVRVDRDPASAHRIQVRTDVGAVQIDPLP
ncbi:hypothetical protein [Actinoplanes sp. M2I2]|uniref:hypothetical protein n=1 Tax=Actinoplanes sp. M2I2 TaxID=1734444 RepID=UPI0020222F9B|nr:hypothetical protein [Actinoplanes sp. M2I2]